jgi:molecular chaperone GrpE (heat shock protein)
VREEMGERPLERGQRTQADKVDAVHKLERKFNQELLQVVQKWERAFAALDEDEQRQVVSEMAKNNMLQAIQMARVAVERYEREQWDN